MRQATIVGYHGRRNLGDDVFLRVATYWLRTRWGIQKAFVTGKQGRLPRVLYEVSLHAFELPNFFIARFLWLQIFYFSLRSRVLLFAAGSIFTIQPFLLAYCVIRALRWLKPSLPVLALGVSVGPIRNGFDAFWCRKLLELFDIVIVRDRDSAEWLRQNAPNAKHVLGYDIALAWHPPSKVESSSPGHTVGICINRARTGSGTSTQALIRTLVDAVATISNISNPLRVLLLVVCSDEDDGDVEITADLAAQLKTHGIASETVVYSGDSPEEYLRNLDECGAIVTSRMHAGILGMMRGVPVFQVAYAPKILSFYSHSEVGTNHLATLETVSSSEVATFLAQALSGELEVVAHRRQQSLRQCAEAIAKIIGEQGDLRG